MCIKKVSMWKAANGSLHENERDAILVSICHVLGKPLPFVINEIELRLDKLMPLFSQLMDPRNQPPKATLRDEGDSLESPPLLIPADEQSIDQQLEGVTGVERTPHWGAAEDIDPLDIRIGQVIEIDDDAFGRGEILIEDFTDTVVSGQLQSNDLEFNAGPIDVALDKIVRIVKQPEELLDIIQARSQLASLDMENGNSPFDHKRRILLNRRIAELEPRS